MNKLKNSLNNKGELIISQGRIHLMINGFVVATQGEKCHDLDLILLFQSQVWNKDMMEHVISNGLARMWTKICKIRLPKFQDRRTITA